MKTTLAFLLLTYSMFSFALSEDTEQFLRENNIKLFGSEITEEHIADFRESYDKLPPHLTKELVNRGRELRLIYGKLTNDPSFRSQTTIDGRETGNVLGIGGSAYWKRPTRIVVDRLHDRSQNGHGSVDLYLHEEAHTIDSTYGQSLISKTKKWVTIHKIPSVRAYLKKYLNDAYVNSAEESFAELFARFHAGPEPRDELYAQVPEVAEYFENFRSIREASKGQGVSFLSFFN